MNEGTSFKPIIQCWPGKGPNPKEVTSVIVSIGKIYYDVLDKFKKENYVIFNIEELMPFPEVELKKYLSNISKKAKVLYLQEEQMNAGGYQYIEPHLARILSELEFADPEPIYVGRRALACSATGTHKKHTEELNNIFNLLKSHLEQ